METEYLEFDIKGVIFKFIKIPGGVFFIGKNIFAIDRKWRIRVRLDSFFMLETTITQKQFECIMGVNPSLIKGLNFPVINVNYHEAKLFCEKFNQIIKDFKADLPTEYQWEYAAKADSNFLYSGSNNLSEVGWFIHNSEYKIHQVAQLKPNGFGLFDMSGNVMEWTSGSYIARYSYLPWPIKGLIMNPTNSGILKNVSVRGGCFIDNGELCKVSSRSRMAENARPIYLGFRIILT